MQSIIEILAINVKEGVSKKPPHAPYKISEAHCVLRNTDGSAAAVGVLQVPKKLDEVAKVGLFTAGFTLTAPTYGDNQGKIVAELASLTPIKPEQLRPARSA